MVHGFSFRQDVFVPWQIRLPHEVIAPSRRIAGARSGRFAAEAGARSINPPERAQASCGGKSSPQLPSCLRAACGEAMRR
jgi:hypothetical protein